MTHRERRPARNAVPLRAKLRAPANRVGWGVSVPPRDFTRSPIIPSNPTNNGRGVLQHGLFIKFLQGES